MTRPSSTLTEQGGEAPAWPADALPQRAIEHVFSVMHCEYGKRFSDLWGGLDPQAMKQHWARRLAGLTREELACGLRGLRGKDWPPTLPEFIKLCRPPVDPARAYHEAVDGMVARVQRQEMGHWSHPAIFWAAVEVGSFDLLNQGYDKLKVRWEKALQAALDAGAWDPIPAPMLALPAPGRAATSNEEAKRQLAALKAELARRQQQDQADPPTTHDEEPHHEN
jgi:hypothetical protein